ncbi:MAG: DUF4435 domain-containing protein [Bacilli bacterium]|nr:DUF4435 domain-containing protein [Bacilli bacterium]
MKNQDIRYSIDELIGMLNHSSQPTILVEGIDDMRWYRCFEQEFYGNAQVFQVGGRKMLFKLYMRRHEITSKVVYVADRDMYVFGHVPRQYKDIIFTKGYSIENDLLSKSMVVQALFLGKDKDRLGKLLPPLAKWFAFCVEEFKSGKFPVLTDAPQCVISEKAKIAEIRPEYKIKIGFYEPDVNLEQKILRDFDLKFRGKNLSQVYALIFSKRKHKEEGAKFSDVQLLEIAAKDIRSKARKRLVRMINEAIKSDLSR